MLNITVISPEVATGDRDVSAWLSIVDGALVLNFTKGGRAWALPLVDADTDAAARNLEYNLAVVMKELSV